MATKPKAAVNPAADPAAEEAPHTRCQGGPDINVAIVSLHQGDPVDLHLTLCMAAFAVRVFLDDALIAQTNHGVDDFHVTLPPLGIGNHSLTWSYIAAGTPWQCLSELTVSGTPRFRKLKGDPSSTMASNNLALILEVL
jgi:hypothetical protein